MKDILIIGYGNPLRGDDGVGWHAARKLEEQAGGRSVKVVVCQQLLPELAEPISRADFVIFIDACCDNSPGRLVSRPVKPDLCPPSGFSHRVNPAVLLAAAKRLYGKSPEAILFSVSGEYFGHGEEFSPAVQAVFPALLERVQQACGLANQAGRQPYP